MTTADRRVGVIVRPHRADAAVHVDLAADRYVDDDHRRHGARRAAARAHAARRQGQDHRKVFRARARHHGIDRDFFDGEFPVLTKLVRADMPGDFVRLAARVREHFRHALFRRQNDR